MSQSAPAPVVIACPHCGTRYQIPYGAIGAKGRNVLCAQCGQSWQAHAEPPEVAAPPPPPPPPAPARADADEDFGALAEAMLDEKFVIEEQRQKARREASLRAQADEKTGRAKARANAQAEASARAEAAVKAETEARAAAIAQAIEATKAAGSVPEAGAPPARSPEHQRTIDEIRAAVGGEAAEPDASTRLSRQDAFSRRQQLLRNRLPMARLRRLARWGAAGLLVLIAGGGVLARGPLVMQFPQLAGPYAAIGLPVNVIGLEFRDVHTLQSLQQGAELLAVEGEIASVAGHEVTVPEVIITLLGPKGRALYEWSMTPKAQELEPGEHVGFSTQLTTPPAGARDVRLSFATGRTPPRADDGASGDPTGPDAVGAAAPPAGGDGPIIFAKTAGASELGQNPAR